MQEKSGEKITLTPHRTVLQFAFQPLIKEVASPVRFSWKTQS